MQRQNCWHFRARTAVWVRRYCTILLLIEQTTALLCVTEATLDPSVKMVGDSQSQGWMVAWQSFDDRRKPRRRLASWWEAFYSAGSRSSSCCPSVRNNCHCVGYLAVTAGPFLRLERSSDWITQSVQWLDYWLVDRWTWFDSWKALGAFSFCANSGRALASTRPI